jgi:hypothetical protein
MDADPAAAPLGGRVPDGERAMSRLFCGAVAGLAVLCAACASGGNTGSGSGPQPTRGANALRAQPLDTVYVIEHYVRPERREQFEDFVLNVLWPAFRNDASERAEGRRVLDGLRLLQPTAPDEDGVLTYSFVLDPHVNGESYDIYRVLLGLYPEAEALRQYTRFTETWARDFTTHAYIQFADPSGQ